MRFLPPTHCGPVFPIVSASLPCALAALQAHAFFPLSLRDDLAPFFLFRLPLYTLSTLPTSSSRVSPRSWSCSAPTLPTLFSLFIRKALPHQIFSTYVVVVVISSSFLFCET